MGLASIVIARVLGPNGQGIVASLVAAVGIIIQFGNLGIYAANIRFVGANKKLFANASSNSLIIGLVLGAASFTLLYTSTLLYPDAYGEIPLSYLIIYAISIPFSLLIVLFQGMILAVEKIRTYNTFILARSLMVFLGTTALLLLLKKGVFEIILLLVAVEVLTCIGYMHASHKIEKIRLRFDYPLLKDMVKYGLKVYVATQMTYLVLKFDILLVNYYLGLAQAGVYSIAAKIADLIYLIPATIALIYFPRATALKEKARPFTNKVLLYLTALMFCGCALSYVIAEPTILFLFGSQYQGAILPLKILIPGIFFIAIETILMNYFASKDMPAFAVYTPIIGLAANILMNMYTIPAYGIEGAAAASTIAYALMFLMLAVYYHEKR
jgi:O-antigen/teichoic acid export membrane protein